MKVYNSIERVMNKSFMDNFPMGLDNYINTIHFRLNPTSYWVKHWEDSRAVSIIMHYKETKINGVWVSCDKDGYIEFIRYAIVPYLLEGEEICFE